MQEADAININLSDGKLYLKAYEIVFLLPELETLELAHDHFSYPPVGEFYFENGLEVNQRKQFKVS